MLITSNRTRRWIIPKGWPMKRKEPHAAAAREALEEAGVRGKVGTTPLGSYSYRKRLRTGRLVVCEVVVFPLEVKRQRKRWPDKGKRQIQWLSPTEAAKTVRETVLSDLIRKLETRA